MCEDVYKGNEHDRWEVFPVEIEHIFYEVNDRNGHDNEEDEHRNHRKDAIEDRVKQIAERDLKNSDPFSSFEAVLFIEGEVFVSTKNVDTDWKTTQTA